MTNYICKRIKEFRIREGHKMYMVNKLIGCSVTTYWSIEKGNKIPDYLMLLKIAKALNTTIDELTKGDELSNYDQK